MTSGRSGAGEVPAPATVEPAPAASAANEPAALSLGMSYRRSWLLVEMMNRCFLGPLVATSSHRRRGAALTADGRLVLRLYRRIQSRSRRAVQSDLAALLRLLR